MNGTTAPLIDCGFNAAEYVALYPDLVTAGFSVPAGLMHFLEHGLAEGRAAPIDCSLMTFEQNLRDASMPDAGAIIRSAAEWVSIHCFSYPVTESTLLFHIEGSRSFRPLLVIGDSHIHAYRGQRGVLDAGFLPIPLQCLAASARGLANPASIAGYGRKIRLFLQDAASRLASVGGLLIFKFGQVDVEFVHTLKRIEWNETAWSWSSAIAYMDTGIAAYVQFLSKLRLHLPKTLPIMVASIFPPALYDHEIRKGYMNAHIAGLHGVQNINMISSQLATLEFPDLIGRTRLHAEFNKRLQAAAKGAGLGFIDDFSGLLEGESISTSLVEAHGGTDHHIDPTSAILASTLAEALLALAEKPTGNGGRS